jgi:threonine dehydrogenase-like Zn-dependent dehydrogenase
MQRYSFSIAHSFFVLLKVVVGAKVSHLKVGDRVSMEPGATCYICENCKSGRYEVSTITTVTP